jgi:hypothetical protein
VVGQAPDSAQCLVLLGFHNNSTEIKQGLQHVWCVLDDDGIRTLKQDGPTACTAKIAPVISSPGMRSDAHKRRPDRTGLPRSSAFLRASYCASALSVDQPELFSSKATNASKEDSSESHSNSAGKVCL